MTTTSQISSEIDTFVAQQNQVRSTAGLALDYNSLTTTVPAGGNAVSGLTTLTTSGTMSLGSSGYNALILGGANSIQASASGAADNWAVSVPSAGSVTLLDENTGQTLAVTGDSYLVFNGGVPNSDGSLNIKIVGGGNFADVALMYDAALQRQPDLPGLEFYAAPIAAGTMTLHQAATYFLASPEFAKDYPALTSAPDNGGPNDQAFITELYGNILHRTPTAAEVAYYVDALNGTLTNSAGQAIPATDRAQLLIYFSASPENQHNSTWLINTDSGAYQDAGYAVPGSVSASTELNVSAGGTINTASIDMSTITGGFISVNGGFGGGGITVNTSQDSILSGEANVTIYLSSQVKNANLAAENISGDTVYSSSAGGSDIQFGLGGNTIHLSGTGNVLENPSSNAYSIVGAAAHAAPAAQIVYGAMTGDSISFDRTGGANGIDYLAAPSAGTKIQGSSLLISTGAAVNFGVNTIAIDVGTISDNSAATMAAAAAAVYQPSATGTGNINNGSESVLFYGERAGNDIVVYKWLADSTHTISATTMVAGIDLVGVNTVAELKTIMY